MANKESPESLPSDEHLRKDVAPDAAGDTQDGARNGFTPGQTNAGQQVAGLASASGYGSDLDPDKQPEGNNPV
ncbi:hypothetical protein [Arthrobacter sp.]|uniref:hypothetical protein n=1 Tax=Arthrobacter sp. TaxID=1667 RepID=UPI0028115360|nr:hypothetical protein [Arthrobacter sp.]